MMTLKFNIGRRFYFKEIERILIGIDNNINIEDVLYDFGKRSGVVDIENLQMF